MMSTELWKGCVKKYVPCEMQELRREFVSRTRYQPMRDREGKPKETRLCR